MKLTQYNTTFVLPAEDLLGSELFFSADLQNTGGIDTKDLSRNYPEHCRRTVPEWLDIADSERDLNVPIFIHTCRNFVQNKRAIGYSASLGIVQSSDEHAELSRRPFYGLAFLNNGRLRAEKFYPSEGFSPDVSQFAAGVPVLWDGECLTLEDFLPEDPDFSHIWDMILNSTNGWPPKDIERFAFLQEVFEKHRHSSSEEASGALITAARGNPEDSPLRRSHHYLNQGVGIMADGGLVIVVANCSYEEMGAKLKRCGACSGIVVDQGGSPAVLFRAALGEDLRTWVESYYHRPRAVAIAIHKLKDGWFQGDDLRGLSGRAVFTARLRSPGPQAKMTFVTDHGIVEREFTAPECVADPADLGAVSIANFAAVHGASAVSISAELGFARRVQSRFNERFCVTPALMDRLRCRGLWFPDYLQVINGTPFAIASGEAAASRAPVFLGRLAMYGEKPLEWALGIDIGGTAVKVVILYQGTGVKGEAQALTRVDSPDYDSESLARAIRTAVHAAAADASVHTNKIQACVVSWPGAVRHGKASSSKTLLNMRDVLFGNSLNVERFEQIRDLRVFLSSILGFGAGVPLTPVNDGEVEAAYEAAVNGRRNVLLCKIGTSVAGGFVDREGNSNYLTELGRCVIRTDSHAPRSPSTRIQGVASSLVGSFALCDLCHKSNIRRADGTPVSANDPGREIAELINAGGPLGSAAEAAVREMGINIANLLLECEQHLPRIEHILLRGGLVGDHVVGKLLRSAMTLDLPRSVGAKIVEEAPSQYSGAYSAAWLASRRFGAVDYTTIGSAPGSALDTRSAEALGATDNPQVPLL